MFISHKYKVIFVHIQRTGGNSVQKIFAECDPDLIEIVPIDPSKQRTKHCYIVDIREAMSSDIFNQYKKFCIVRNPFDRMVSWYFHFKTPRNKEDARIKTNKSDRVTELYHRGLDLLAPSGHAAALYTKVWTQIFRALRRFDLNSTEEIAMRFSTIGERVRYEVNRHAADFKEFTRLPEEHSNGLFKRFYMNQLDYISDDKMVLMDKILRFESLTQDFSALADEIGFPGKLPHINKASQSTGYQDYFDSESRERIERRFQRDLAYFGYQF